MRQGVEEKKFCKMARSVRDPSFLFILKFIPRKRSINFNKYINI